MTKNFTVYKSNKVIEAGYKLSLNEQRLILSCIAKVNSTKPLLLTERFEISAKEFSGLFELSEDKAYQTLKKVAEQLFERYVMIDTPDPDEPTLRYTKTRWISSIDYIPEVGKVALYFAPRMLPYLGTLKGQFTFYQLKNISKMRSIYGIRLYELLMQWQTTGQRKVDIQWLKKQFQIEGKYKSIKDFKKYVIEPAINDINTHANYTVQWTQSKTGRRVTHLNFVFDEKQSDKLPVQTKERTIAGVSYSEISHLAKPGE